MLYSLIALPTLGFTVGGAGQPTQQLSAARGNLGGIAMGYGGMLMTIITVAAGLIIRATRQEGWDGD